MEVVWSCHPGELKGGPQCWHLVSTSWRASVHSLLSIASGRWCHLARPGKWEERPPRSRDLLGAAFFPHAADLWRDFSWMDCILQDFWDTAGQERFQSMHASYYHKAHACIMVFDVQRKITYKNLSTWYAELREFRPEVPCIVVANKIDADIKMTQKSFNFARKFSLPLYFVSAADGTNVVKLFNDAIRLAVSYKQNSRDFMDEVLQELENFDLEQKEENVSEQEQRGNVESPSAS
uniref:RAB, member of RAS oncogene family like 2B n=1 Tax=Equus caballus TaxID=9796 RepID=A0A9L0RV41_HORSE